MPRDIRLDCYHFQFKKKNSKKEYLFKDFFESFNNDKSLSQPNQYSAFFADLQNYFGSEFRINKNETKGLTISSNDNYLIESDANFVSGILRGGDTGIGKEIQERNNSDEGDQVDQSKIHSIPHYFLMWMPTDLNFCIVIVQSYTGESLSGMFLQHLENYFKQKDILTFGRKKFLPQRLVDDFKNNAKVRSVTLKSTQISRQKRQEFNPVLTEKEKLKVELVLKGFGKDSYWNDLKNWLTQPSDNLLGVSLENIDLDHPADRVVEYNYQGKNSKGKMTKDYQIIPSLVITDEIDLNNERHPVYDSIHQYSSIFMEELIEEAGY